MSDDSIGFIAKLAAAAAGMGAFARVVFAAKDGKRGWWLVVEGGIGAALGVVAAAAVVWLDPAVKADSWAIFITAGAAGLAGAMGTRGLDLLTAYLERHPKGK